MGSGRTVHSAGPRTLASQYIRFSAEHATLWNVLFEPNFAHCDQLPDWHQEQVKCLLGLVEPTLVLLIAPTKEIERLRSARMLWSVLHDVCALVDAGVLARS